MEKQTKITYLLFFATAVSGLVSRFFSFFFKLEKPFFFIVTICLSLAFACSVVYNIILYRTKDKPKDIWKMGFLGLVGLLGLVPSFTGFFGFFGFFAFFGLRNSRK